MQFVILQSTDGIKWNRLGEPFSNKLTANGACGAAKARLMLKGIQVRVAPLYKRPHITVILGAVAAQMWLQGYDEIAITKHLAKQYKKYNTARKLTPANSEA